MSAQKPRKKVVRRVEDLRDALIKTTDDLPWCRASAR
ncbi:hypothetical protein HD596_001094 [Nonomuraea jabiensis]|uniref:Uncharacterized protein n=1 Tax=Nonomuraea jabiensis TaxID=882448 RepID=A0A7W9FZC8_9ACTN|nr:hypothetical protein [Nonomuraea jabiensis]